MEKSASNREAFSFWAVALKCCPYINNNVLAYNYNHPIYLPRPDIVFNIAPIQEAGV